MGFEGHKWGTCCTRVVFPPPVSPTSKTGSFARAAAATLSMRRSEWEVWAKLGSRCTCSSPPAARGACRVTRPMVRPWSSTSRDGVCLQKVSSMKAGRSCQMEPTCAQQCEGVILAEGVEMMYRGHARSAG